MPSHTPSHTSRHEKAPPSVATVKSTHMSDKIRNAPTLGPSDSISQMSQRSSQAEPSHTSRAPKARSSGMSEHRSRGAGTNDHTRRGESSHLSVISERSGASGSMSGGSKVPSYLSWAPMSNASGGSTPHGSVSRGSGQHAPSRHAAAPSHVSGAAGPSGSHRTAGPSGSHHTAAPMSTHSNMSGQSRSSSGSRQPERQMTVASSAGGQSSRHHSEAPTSQGSVMSRHGSHISSSSRQSASSGSHHTSMTQYGGKSGHRSVIPSPLGQAPVHKGMRGSFSTSTPKSGETVELNINIRTTRK